MSPSHVTNHVTYKPIFTPKIKSYLTSSSSVTVITSADMLFFTSDTNTHIASAIVLISTSGTCTDITSDNFRFSFLILLHFLIPQAKC
jgi:hypothetical protein